MLYEYPFDVAMHGSTTTWRMAWQIPANAVFAMAITGALRRTIGFPLRFERSRDVLVYAALVLVFSVLLALTAPAFVLAFAGVEKLYGPLLALVRIALANIAPLLLVTPAVVLCARLDWRRASAVWRRRGVETAIVIGSVLVASVVALDGGPELARFPSLLLLTFPPLLWAAVRLGPTGAATSLVCVAALSLVGAARTLGPFVAPHSDVLLSVEIYWILICPPVMLLAATIREREAAESSLHEQRNQLAHLARIATAGELSAELAHELRQPMQSILSSAPAGLQVLAREPIDVAQIREIFADIVQQDGHASKVVARLRSLLKGSATTLEPVALASVVEDALALTRHAAVRASVDVQARVSPDLPRIRGDRVQLLQVLVNLALINSKWKPPGSATSSQRSARRADLRPRPAMKPTGEPFFTPRHNATAGSACHHRRSPLAPTASGGRIFAHGVIRRPRRGRCTSAPRARRRVPVDRPVAGRHRRRRPPRQQSRRSRLAGRKTAPKQRSTRSATPTACGRR